MQGVFTQTFGLGKEFSENLIGTLDKLHEIGFDGVEPLVMFNPRQGKLPKNLWALDTLEEAKQEMDALGMTIPSAHIGVSFGWLSMPVGAIVKNIREVHDRFGISDFVISGMFSTPASTAHWARLVRRISDGVQPYGCRILYHNHDDEFHKISCQGSKTDAMERFLHVAGQGILLQLDIGWAGIAGNEVEIVKKYGASIASLHLKDFYPAYRNGLYSRKNLPVEAFAPIGAGGIRTEAVLKLRDTLPNYGGAVIIDQDKTAGDMLEALKIGYANIRAMLKEEK